MFGRTYSRRRTGFTLVELLVVVSILSILAALITAAAMRALYSAEDARVSAEIRQLETGISNFKSTYNASYLPSRIRLRARLMDYVTTSADAANNQFESASKSFLSTMFPRLPANQVIQWYPSFTQNSVIDLNGSECLVFFLGGPNGLDGFTKNPTNPVPPAGARGVVSFEFDRNRLRAGVFCQRGPGTAGASAGSSNPSPALVYLDQYSSGSLDDQPFYYFSSKNGNDYDANDAIAIPSASYQAVSTSSLNNFKIGAHLDPTGRFYNPLGFQIISAGRDKLHANLTLVNAAGATSPPPVGFLIWSNGAYPGTASFKESVDNLCNFHPAKMGIPQ